MIRPSTVAERPDGPARTHVLIAAMRVRRLGPGPRPTRTNEDDDAANLGLVRFHLFRSACSSSLFFLRRAFHTTHACQNLHVENSMSSWRTPHASQRLDHGRRSRVLRSPCTADSHLEKSGGTHCPSLASGAIDP